MSDELRIPEPGILPCPFCGEADEIWIFSSERHGRPVRVVECQTCSAQVAVSESNAHLTNVRWNRRATSPERATKSEGG
jgi:Lar family restriction alleviation protein